MRASIPNEAVTRDLIAAPEIKQAEDDFHSLRLTAMDGLIKLSLATGLGVISFRCEKPASFIVIMLFLVVTTWLARVNGRTMLVSAASYGMIVVMPYLLGIAMNELLYLVTVNPVFVYRQGIQPVVLKLVRLFLIWYISVFYFQITPIETVIGMADRMLSPLKRLGVPIEEYLKVTMCVVIELRKMPSEVKRNLGLRMRRAVGKNRWDIKAKIKGVADILVTLIVDSFQKLGRIQSFVEEAAPGDLYNYRFRLSKYDGMGIIAVVLLAGFVFLLEKAG